jgi:hypothetical protein
LRTGRNGLYIPAQSNAKHLKRLLSWHREEKPFPP